MIRLTPILLVGAAQAVAARAAEGASRPDDSLGFVQHVGYWSHFDPVVAASSWPFVGVNTLGAMAREAERLAVLGPQPMEGALVLVGDARERPRIMQGGDEFRADGEYCRVGVVTRVVRRSRLPRDFVSGCEVIWGRGAREVCVFDAGRGDRFVHWWRAVRRAEGHRVAGVTCAAA